MLRNAAETDDDHRGILWIGCIQWRATIRTEDLGSSVSALSDLDVTLRASLKVEVSDGNGDEGSEGRARQDLAIRAMADHDPGRVDLCCETDLSAMTSAVDIHGEPQFSV